MKLLPALVAAAALAVVTSHVAISTALAAPADQVTCPAMSATATRWIVNGYLLSLAALAAIAAVSASREPVASPS